MTISTELCKSARETPLDSSERTRFISALLNSLLRIVGRSLDYVYRDMDELGFDHMWLDVVTTGELRRD